MLGEEYKGADIYISENGISDMGGTKDVQRVLYFNHYLDNILKAIDEGVNVKGYIAWSLMDNFEWRAGRTEKFGLYHVDYTSSNKTRTAKMSARVYKKIVETNEIDFNYSPDPEVFIEHPTQYVDYCKDSGSSFQIHFTLIVFSIVTKIFNYI